MKKIIKNKGAIYCNVTFKKQLNSTINKLQPSKIFVLVDENTKHFCLPIFLKENESLTFEILEVPSGEINKNISTCLSLWNALSEKGADRNSLLINLGGGVITDMGGFVASTFKRGIAFINIPTTLLSMVDASVGGKNGVDLGVLKNQIGVINNPEIVLIQTQFLNTLPANEITSGYAEMLKHGLIHSKEYWNKIKVFDESNIHEIEDLLWESVLIKNEVITEDPYEKGIRKTLNFGHTLGHAIETYCLTESNKNNLLHGEAVANGMVLACYISTKLTGLSQETLNDVSNHILNKFSKIEFNKADIESIIDLLKFDKKNSNGKVLFVLLEDIGICKLNCEVPNKLIFEAFEFLFNK